MASQAPAREEGYRSGFTLIELLTVLVLVVVLASVAVPKLDFPRYAVTGAANSIGSALLLAQRQAVQEQHPVVVAFDAAGGRIRIHGDDNGNLLIDGGEAVRYEVLPEGVRLARGTAASMFEGDGDVTFTTSQSGLPAVVFQRNGSASEEGGFYLTSARATASADHAGDTRAAEIQRSTGRAIWYRYADAAWEPDT